MPKFAANLTMLFTELPFLLRFQAAASAGFNAVEFLPPYDHEKQQIAGLLEAHDLELVLHNLPCGDWNEGERGIAAHPDRIGEFREGVARAIDYATTLGAPQLNFKAGLSWLRPHGIGA
jgi:hydroxypyruvate isomerase